jgi:diphthamide synthase (EF-2-diphthine--ammonia ligase)
MMEKIAISWSGGKDSALALHLALASGLKPQVLLCCLMSVAIHAPMV